MIFRRKPKRIEPGEIQWDRYPRFTGAPPQVEYVTGTTDRITRDISYTLLDGRTSMVRVGFVFDWASVPFPLSVICPPRGTSRQHYGVAALWHDWLYRHGQIQGQTITQADADGVFLEIMLYLGVNAALARTMWTGVRIGGWYKWNKNRRKNSGG
jgi:hypothetical protein